MLLFNREPCKDNREYKSNVLIANFTVFSFCLSCSVSNRVSEVVTSHSRWMWISKSQNISFPLLSNGHNKNNNILTHLLGYDNKATDSGL